MNVLFCEFLFDRRLSAIFAVEHAYSVENLFLRLYCIHLANRCFFWLQFWERVE